MGGGCVQARRRGGVVSLPAPAEQNRRLTLREIRSTGGSRRANSLGNARISWWMTSADCRETAAVDLRCTTQGGFGRSPANLAASRADRKVSQVKRRTWWILGIALALAILGTPGAKGTPSQLLGQFLVNFLIFSAIVGAIVSAAFWVIGRTRSLVPATAVIAHGQSPMVSALATTKKCPQCAEEIQVDARLCRYCRFEFPQAVASSE